MAVHMDGARFTNALVALGASPADMTWRAGVDVLSLGATKSGALACEAVISEEVFATGKLSPGGLPISNVDIRGRAEPIAIRTVAQASMLTVLLSDSSGRTTDLALPA